MKIPLQVSIRRTYESLGIATDIGSGSRLEDHSNRPGVIDSTATDKGKLVKAIFFDEQPRALQDTGLSVEAEPTAQTSDELGLVSVNDELASSMFSPSYFSFILISIF